jgi:proteasome activator subunit 4
MSYLNLNFFKLLGKKNSTRPELIQRIMLQYKFRTFHIHTRLNEYDLRIIDVLFRLSTDSNYAIVRKDSQTQLFSILAHFPYSSLLIVPKIVDILNRATQNETDNKVEHDQLKGCLYLISGNSNNESLMVKQNWRVIATVWPTLFRCQQYEKPSIQALLDRIYYKCNKDYDSFDNRIKLSQQVLDLVYEFNPLLRTKFRSDSERLRRFEEKCELETALISNLINELVKITKESQKMWKNQSTCFGSISLLFNTCRINKNFLTVEFMQLLVDSLVSDNIQVRKLSIDDLCIIMKMVKHRKQTKEISSVDLVLSEARRCSSDQITVNIPCPGFRSDNLWHTFDPLFIEDAQKWELTHFLDKTYWGYYCWPTKMRVNLNKRKTYPLEDFDADPMIDLEDNVDPFEKCMNILRDRFKNDSEFVEKFIRLSTIEESKGNEKFDRKRFYLFKALFRNFGSSKIINNLYSHLQRLISDKQPQTHECSHKLAAEMLSGLMRGSKYWRFDDLKDLWLNLKPIFDLMFENITSETQKLWFTCFSNAFEDQDPRRLTFYMNYLSDLVKKIFFKKEDGGDDFVIVEQQQQQQQQNLPTSFQQASCLNLVSALSQTEWRSQAFWASLIDLLMANMNHPYKTIREKIGA